jgi:hypothetical protein
LQFGQFAPLGSPVLDGVWLQEQVVHERRLFQYQVGGHRGPRENQDIHKAVPDSSLAPETKLRLRPSLTLSIAFGQKLVLQLTASPVAMTYSSGTGHWENTNKAMILNAGSASFAGRIN